MQPSLKADAEVVAIQPEVGKLTTFARSLAIKTAEGYQSAADHLKTIKGLLAKIEDARTRVTKPLLEAQRQVNAQAKEAAAPLQTAESLIKRAMIAYNDEQERIRREEQRKAEEAARRERERLQKIADEAAAKARAEQDRLRREAEAAAAAGRAAEAAKLAAQAVKVEEKAAAKVEAFEQRAAVVVAPVIQHEAPKVAGVSTRDVWKHECVDLKALAKAVAEGRAPVSYLLPNDKVLGNQARSLKADFVCDGVRVWSEKSLASGAA